MSKLLTSYTIGSLELKNRMVMSPMTRCRAGEGGVPTSMNANYYQQRASADLIVAEGTQISLQSVGYPATPSIHTLAQVADWKIVTDAVDSPGDVWVAPTGLDH